MGPNGYFKVWRKVFENPILNHDPFDRFHAFLYLVANANFMPRQVWFQKSMHDVQRGQLVTTYRQLARDWKWSREKVLNFVRVLDRTATIKPQTSHGCLLVTICNYETYQDQESPTGHRPATDRPATGQRPASDQPRHKKDKKDKNGEELGSGSVSGIINLKETTPTVGSTELFLELLKSKKIRGTEKTFLTMIPGWIASVGAEQARLRIRAAKDGMGVFELDKLFVSQSSGVETAAQKWIRFSKGEEPLDVAQKLLEDYFAVSPPYEQDVRDKKGRAFSLRGKSYEYNPQLEEEMRQADIASIEKMEREHPGKLDRARKDLNRGAM
jgi:hypothetical protein